MTDNEIIEAIERAIANTPGLLQSRDQATAAFEAIRPELDRLRAAAQSEVNRTALDP